MSLFRSLNSLRQLTLTPPPEEEADEKGPLPTPCHPVRAEGSLRHRRIIPQSVNRKNMTYILILFLCLTLLT